MPKKTPAVVSAITTTLVVAGSAGSVWAYAGSPSIEEWVLPSETPVQTVTVDPTDAANTPTSTESPTPQPEPTTTEPAVEPVAFGDGTFVVWQDIEPGIYRATPSAYCYWQRLSGFYGTPAETIASGQGDVPQLVSIEDGDAGFYSYLCGPWRKVEPTH